MNYKRKKKHTQLQITQIKNKSKQNKSWYVNDDKMQ